MKTIIAAILALFMFGSVLAAPARWYVGGALQCHTLKEAGNVWPSIESTSRTSAVTSWPFRDNSSIIESHRGLGFQFEGGRIGNIWSAFLGFRQTYARYHTSAGRLDPDLGEPFGWESGSTIWWYDSRFLLGGRLHYSQRRPEPLKPFIGAGISAGWLRRTQDDFSNFTSPPPFQSRRESSHASQTSKLTVGWFGEAGLFLFTHGPFTFSASVRYDDLRLYRDFTLPNGIDGDYAELSFQLGTIYQFRK
jgi:hypothetical protein